MTLLAVKDGGPKTLYRNRLLNDGHRKEGSIATRFDWHAESRTNDLSSYVLVVAG